MAMSDDWLARLRAAIASDRDQRHRIAHTATLDLVRRAGGATDEDGAPAIEGWAEFPRAAAAVLGEPGWQVTLGVMANMIAVAGFAEPRDLLTLDELVRRYGHRAIAATQATVDELLGSGDAMPVATAFATRVGRLQPMVDLLVADGVDRDAALDVAGRCHRAGYWLVMGDVDLGVEGPELTTVEAAVACLDNAGIQAWRAQVAVVAGNPWAPYPRTLVSLLRAGDRPEAAAALEASVRYYRERVAQQDRDRVAREVRRLVEASGLSQRQFAALCGTSAPRLSTYVNGLATPSAAMMLRLARVSKREQERAAAAARRRMSGRPPSPDMQVR